MNRRIQARAGSASIPLVVVGGPSDASRAAVLQRLLTRNDGRRLAVVHDGRTALAIDDALIDTIDGGARRLQSGSVSLAIDGDASIALAELRASPQPVECVVLEAAAGTSLQRMSGYAYMPGYRPGGTVLVTDATTAVAEAESGSLDPPPLARELARAELVVLDDVDLLEPARRRGIRRWIQDQAPGARVVECEQNRVPPALLLGIGPGNAPAHARLGDWTPRFSLESDPRRRAVAAPRHDEDFRAWLLTVREPIDPRDFRAWVAAMPESILRGDGALRLRGEQRQAYRFHLCGSRWSLTASESPPDRELGWLSLVGLSSQTRPASAGTSPSRSS